MLNWIYKHWISTWIFCIFVQWQAECEWKKNLKKRGGSPLTYREHENIFRLTSLFEFRSVVLAVNLTRGKCLRKAHKHCHNSSHDCTRVLLSPFIFIFNTSEFFYFKLFYSPIYQRLRKQKTWYKTKKTFNKSCSYVNIMALKRIQTNAQLLIIKFCHRNHITLNI